MRYAVERVTGNVAYAGPYGWAYWHLASQRHSFRSENDRVSSVTAGALRYAGMMGMNGHLRVTSRPQVPEDWATATRAGMVDPLPDVDRVLARSVRRLRSLNCELKETYLGLRIARPTVGRVAAMVGAGGRVDEMYVAERLEKLNRLVAGAGLRGKPVPKATLEWLLHRSAALGVPDPDGVLAGDLDELADRARWETDPPGGRRSAINHVRMPGGDVTRHVAVVTFGRMAEVSEADPWLARPDALGVPYDLSVRFRVLTDKEVAGRLRKALARVKGQWAHSVEHDQEPDPTLVSAMDRGAIVTAELAEGFSDLRARVELWGRIAVSGVDEKECMAAADAIVDLYQPKVRAVIPRGQFRLAMEFVPCEELSNPRAYSRQMPVTTFAAGLPAVTARIGTPTGHLFGFTVGAAGRHPFTWDLHDAMENRERPGVTRIGGTPGSGKSTALGHIVYVAALSGVRCMVLDPSGPLGRLCDLPEFAGVAQHIDLMNARPGSLNPWVVIPDPRRSDFGSHPVGAKLYAKACRLVAGERRALCADSLAMLLPLAVMEQPAASDALYAAVRAIVDGPTTSPLDALAVLAKGDFADADFDQIRAGRTMAHRLHDMTDLPGAQLLFPTGDSDLDYQPTAEPPRLTVITMADLVLPDETRPRAEWTTTERLAMANLPSAAWLASRVMYDDRDERTVFAVDEFRGLTLVSAGRYLSMRTSRDSRKFDTRVLFAGQNFADFEAVGLRASDDGLQNLVDNDICGRTEGDGPQAAAIRAMRLPADAGYEAMLGHLSDHEEGVEGRSGVREFVVTDGRGGCEVVQWDRDILPAHVREALDTTATGRRAERVGAVA